MTLDARFLEFMRLHDEDEKERHQEFEKYVKQMGFASIKAYEEDQDAKFYDYGRMLDEKCALLGKTKEQLEAEDPQRWVPDSWLPECDCEDHPVPFFCADSLVDYNSMDSQTFPLTRYLQEQKRARIDDVRIQPGDESRRLSHRALDYYWKSEDVPAELPLWAKKDKVLERMDPLQAPSRAMNLDVQPPSAEPSINESALAAMDVGTTQPKSELPRSFSPRSQTPAAKRDSRSRGLTFLSPGAKEHSRIPRPRVSRRRKKRLATSGAIHKVFQRPAMGTRSHNATEFFELNPDGLPILRSYPGPD